MPHPEAAARPRAAAGVADSAAVGLERRPDASGQRLRSGAGSHAAHRQALCGQGAGGGGADGCKLQRDKRRALVGQPVPGRSRRATAQGLGGILSARAALLV